METLEVKYDEEDLALMLLYSLPPLFMTLRNTIIYSQDTLILNEVCDILLFKEKMMHLASGSKSQVEGLVVRRRIEI